MNSKPYAVGIDIGGTNTVFGIVDRMGKVVAKSSMPTKGYSGFEDYLNHLYEKLSTLIKENNAEGHIAGIGIGAPGANYRTGEVDAANLNWGEHVPLAEAVSDKFGGLPVSVTNDANAATMGEMVYGAAKGMDDFVMITLGTGVGSGIVSNGKLVYGHDGLAGELGHVRVEKNGRQCGCGRKGCLETYCSSTGVVRTAKEFLETRDEPSLLREIPMDKITSKDVYDAAMKGDKMAKEIFDFTGRMLGEALADFTAYSSPEAFVLFGGLMRSGDLLLEPMKKAFDESLLFIYTQKPKILVSTLNEDDGAVLGASALGWG